MGVGEDDPALVRIGKALRVPTVHQLGTRLLARVGRLGHPMTLIGMDRLAGPAGRPRPRGVLLPILMLSASPADLGGTVPLGQRPERGPPLHPHTGRASVRARVCQYMGP